MVVPEPRNRGLRFHALAEFAEGFLAYLSEFEGRDELACAWSAAADRRFPTPRPPTGLSGSSAASPATCRRDGDAPVADIGAAGREAPVLLRRADAWKRPRPGRHQRARPPTGRPASSRRRT